MFSKTVTLPVLKKVQQKATNMIHVFWPTVLCKVAPLSRYVVCLSSSVTFCIVACMTDRLQMFAPTRGFFGDGRLNGTMQYVVDRALLPWQLNLG